MSNGTVRTIEYLEQAFSHGQIPTQCDFWDLIATFSDRGWADFVPLSGFSLMTGPLSTNMLFASCGNSDQWCTAYSLVCANSAAWFNEGQFVPLSGYATVTGPLTTQSINLSGGSITNIGNSGLSFQSGAKIISNSNGGLIFNTLQPEFGTPGGEILIQTNSKFNSLSPNGITISTGPSASTAAWQGGGPLNLIGSYGGTVTIKSNTSSWGKGNIVMDSKQVLLTADDSIFNTNFKVNGPVSSNNIIYAACGNSTQWCSAWSIVSGGIAQGDYVPLSGNAIITNPISTQQINVSGCVVADCITGLTSINLDGDGITSWNNISAYYDLAGMDILPGDLLHVEYSPSSYDIVTPAPGLSAYPLSGHLAGIDSALSCISGVSAITFTNTTVAPTPVKTLSNYLLIKVNGSDMYLPLYT